MDTIWTRAKNDLIEAITALGFPKELGDAAAKHLGSSKAIDRMASYLRQAKPSRAEEIVDEMLAIRAEIDAWKEKKASQHASGTINEMLWYGLKATEEQEL